MDKKKNRNETMLLLDEEQFGDLEGPAPTKNPKKKD